MVVPQSVVSTSETPREAAMTPLQKTAWIEAGFWIAATLLFLALLYQFGPEKAQAAFALIGLLPFAGYVVHRRSGTRGFHPALDERDQEVSLRAGRYGLASGSLVFVPRLAGVAP